MITSSGAEYSYFMVAFGAFPAYMFSWYSLLLVFLLSNIISQIAFRVSTIIIKPSQLAIICLSFAEYVAEAFAYECSPTSDILKIVGITTVREYSR